jgi:hypothetical protein
MREQEIVNGPPVKNFISPFGKEFKAIVNKEKKQSPVISIDSKSIKDAMQLSLSKFNSVL